MIPRVDNPTVFDSFVKAESVLAKHERIAVSISGGSDSDIVLDLIEKVRGDKPVRYVWFDTGVEYQATKDHLVFLEKKYGIEIERFRALKSIPTCCKEYGQPFLSKYVSEQISRLQRNGFKWEDKPLEQLAKEYPKCVSAVGWWCNFYTEKHGYDRPSMFDIARFKWLKEFMTANPPTFAISSNCCKYAKKKVAANFIKETDADLNVFGVRKTEGGVRAGAYSNCYTTGDKDKIATYRPIFWYSDDDKRYYEERFGVTHSDCYTKYGLHRTGCVGCPYSRNVLHELSTIEHYEPKLYRACTTMFRDAYEYTRQFREFYATMQEKEKKSADGQMTFYDIGGDDEQSTL